MPEPEATHLCHHCKRPIYRKPNGVWVDQTRQFPSFCPHAILFTHKPLEG